MNTSEATRFIELFGFHEGIEYAGYELKKIELTDEILTEGKIEYKFNLTYTITKHKQINIEYFFNDHLEIRPRRVRAQQDGNWYKLSLQPVAYEKLTSHRFIIKLVGSIEPSEEPKDKNKI